MSRPDCKTFDGGTSPGIPLGEVREKLNVAEPVSFCKIDIVCGYERRAVLDGGRVIHRVEEMMFKLDGQLSRLFVQLSIIAVLLRDGKKKLVRSFNSLGLFASHGRQHLGFPMRRLQSYRLTFF